MPFFKINLIEMLVKCILLDKTIDCCREFKVRDLWTRSASSTYWQAVTRDLNKEEVFDECMFVDSFNISKSEEYNVDV